MNKVKSQEPYLRYACHYNLSLYNFNPIFWMLVLIKKQYNKTLKYQALEIVHRFIPKLIIVTLGLHSQSWSINPIRCGERGGLHGLPLRIIIRHSAPTNSKFLDFSQLHSYLHLEKSFFTFFCTFYKKKYQHFFLP